MQADGRSAPRPSPFDHEVHELSDDTLSQLTAYCQGVNDGVKHAGRTLPMWATGFSQEEPWSQQSVLLIGNLLSFGGLAVTQQQGERLLVELIQTGLDPARLRELFAPHFDEADFDLLRQVKISSQLSDAALEMITDLPRLAASNAWVALVYSLNTWSVPATRTLSVAMSGGVRCSR